jgi:hypothetical protein
MRFWSPATAALSARRGGHRGGLAALLAVAAALKSAPASDWCQRIALVANVGEEGEGNLRNAYMCRQSPLAGQSRLRRAWMARARYHHAQALGSRRSSDLSGSGGNSWTFTVPQTRCRLCRAVVLTRTRVAPAGC